MVVVQEHDWILKGKSRMNCFFTFLKPSTGIGFPIAWVIIGKNFKSHLENIIRKNVSVLIRRVSIS